MTTDEDILADRVEGTDPETKGSSLHGKAYSVFFTWTVFLIGREPIKFSDFINELFLCLPGLCFHLWSIWGIPSPDIIAVVSWLVLCLQCVLHCVNNFFLTKIQFDPTTYLPNTQMSSLSPPCPSGAYSAWFLASPNLASFSLSLFSFMDAAFPLRGSVPQASRLSTL